MIITYTSFSDGRIMKLLVLLVRNTSIEVPENDLKHVPLLIKFVKKKSIIQIRQVMIGISSNFQGVNIQISHYYNVVIFYLCLNLMRWIILRRILFCCWNVEVYIQMLFTTFSQKSLPQFKLFQKYFPLNFPAFLQ